MSLEAAAFHLDGAEGLSALRRGAAADTRDARRAAAQQFEALFLQMMLKDMRAAGAVDGGLVPRERMEFYQGMHDQQLALSLARGGGIGLAESILRDLGGPGQAPGGPTQLPSGRSLESIRSEASGGRSAPPRDPSERVGARNERAGTAPAPGASDFRPHTPAQFVSAVWPHAERAAARLGVDAAALVAQSALETGWGRRMIRDAAGRPSFNLFGIKATRDWPGETVTTRTLEHVDGALERRREPFRAYADLAAGFDDYVRLIEGKPRYAAARRAGDAAAYVEALQQAGYATDPAYADKLKAILAAGLPGRPAQDSAAAADKVETITERRPPAAAGERGS